MKYFPVWIGNVSKFCLVSKSALTEIELQNNYLCNLIMLSTVRHAWKCFSALQSLASRTTISSAPNDSIYYNILYKVSIESARTQSLSLKCNRSIVSPELIVFVSEKEIQIAQTTWSTLGFSIQEGKELFFHRRDFDKCKQADWRGDNGWRFLLCFDCERY